MSRTLDHLLDQAQLPLGGCSIFWIRNVASALQKVTPCIRPTALWQHWTEFSGGPVSVFVLCYKCVACICLSRTACNY